MASCLACCRGFMFSILTLCTIGATLALLIAIVYYIKKLKIDLMSQSLLIGFVIAICISLLIFIFGVYASFCGGKCAKSLMSILFIIYDLCILAIGIAVLAAKKPIVELVGKAFEINETDVMNQIKDVMKCDDWIVNPPKVSCKATVEDFLGSKGGLIGGIMIGLFVVFSAFIVFAYILLCKKGGEEGGDKSSTEKSQFNTPLTYGW